MIIALAALLLPAAACDSQDGYDVDIDVPGRTQSPDGTNGQTDSPQETIPGTDSPDVTATPIPLSNNVDPS
ncbi:MAG TPA: hypothetical protein PK438_06840, partial [Clostridia bacterium]|nr:hypothetical protein [Clostridia bacterium]